MRLKSFGLIICASILLAAGCDKGAEPSSSRQSVNSVTSQQATSNAWPNSDEWDREIVTAIKAVLNDLDTYNKTHKHFPSQDEFKVLIEQKYKKTLGDDYYYESLQYSDYPGDSGSPHFIIFYALSQKRSYAVGDSSEGGCGFAGCVSYSVNQDYLK